MAILEGKKAIIIGDRDGIPGPAIAECVKTSSDSILIIEKILKFSPDNSLCFSKRSICAFTLSVCF